MAFPLTTDSLTMNPEELRNMSKFVFTRVFERPDLKMIHYLQTGVVMKEQIVFAALMGKVGLKADATCTRKNSGASTVLTEKFWEPQGIEDSLISCLKELNPLFKAYADKIKTYRDRYEMGATSEIAIFLAIVFEEAIVALIWRAIWFGQKDVAVAEAAAPGLVLADDVQFFDYFSGLFDQIFDEVAATNLNRYTISENALTTKAAQLTLAEGRANEIFDEVIDLADPRLKSDPTAVFLVTGNIFTNYSRYLRKISTAFTLDNTMNGLPTIKADGRTIINMETVWDLTIKNEFVDNTTNNAYYLPNRVVFTSKSNIPVATINEGDLTILDSFSDKVSKLNYQEFGFELDAKWLENYMGVVAY